MQSAAPFLGVLHIYIRCSGRDGVGVCSARVPSAPHSRAQSTQQKNKDTDFYFLRRVRKPTLCGSARNAVEKKYNVCGHGEQGGGGTFFFSRRAAPNRSMRGAIAMRPVPRPARRPRSRRPKGPARREQPRRPRWRPRQPRRRARRTTSNRKATATGRGPYGRAPSRRTRWMSFRLDVRHRRRPALGRGGRRRTGMCSLDGRDRRGQT